MPKRQRQQKQDSQPTNPSTTREKEEEKTESQDTLEDDDLNNEEENPEATRSRSKGLKGFLKHAKNQQYRVVETRVALVCSFGIFFKLIYSEGLEELDKELFTTHAAVTYVGLSVLMVIVSAWLDYFPNRLSDVKLRKVKSQGLPLGCVFLPMVCCSALYFSLTHAIDLVNILTVYLVILCVLSAVSIIATLLHFILYPNNIVFFNFAIIGVAFATQHWLKVSIWLVGPSIALYYATVPFLLYSFPHSFTLGEAVIVGQGTTLLLVDTAMQLLKLHNLTDIADGFDVHRHESLLYIELLVLGVIVCCILLSPALYKISQAKQYYNNKFWSGTFICLSLSIGFMVILPWLARLLGGYHPIPLLIVALISSPVRIVLFVYWVMVSIATGVVVMAQSSTGAWAAVFKAKKPSSIWIRKWFHLFAVLVFLPGIALDPDFTSLVASVTAFMFIVFELCRFFKMWPIGEILSQMVQPLLDSKDSGSLVLTHIYLLLGFTLPLWLSPIRNYAGVAKLSLYSGVLALGVGDSIAAICGKFFGKTKWPGTEKTLVGTSASIIAQLLTVLIIILIDPHISFLTGKQWAVTAASITITAVLEAYTWQVDNLILGVFQFAVLLAFI